ncbi:hypothetical protein IU500_19125 [Nocardia terpenica]|uniref:hypothetical protein n=1 Tax=Nocardia terpenica TaxID=455432 RepID=UPI0018934462|nr:hypothetical protein [Nocardia terpenica]MBF6062048.1 hypothetical protein [Nocardia terpenica]MBF6106152.1 hypothetical protein [Nocardia terpenica]MBF6110468.1 hypothetical protein [Nocardia terpenica]MBF6120695.1 hypothetical protein [Nocardia terpenica]MBF6151804.1 hypothetical protein [Nocardia terpenica]
MTEDAEDATVRAMMELERFQAALHVGPEVRDAYCRAEGYAWGYQDAHGPESFDTDRATAFARAYAICIAEYYTETRDCTPPISRAWRAWLAHGDVSTDPDGATS